MHNEKLLVLHQFSMDFDFDFSLVENLNYATVCHVSMLHLQKLEVMAKTGSMVPKPEVLTKPEVRCPKVEVIKPACQRGN